MLDFFIQIVSLTRHLETGAEEQDQMLREVLLFPEMNTFGNEAHLIERAQTPLLEKIAATGETEHYHERQVPTEVSLGEAEILMEPVFRSKAWEEPVALKLATVSWTHEGNLVVHIPVLGINVINRDSKDLEQQLEDEIRSAILRGGHGRTLLDLAQLQRGDGYQLEKKRVNLYPESSRERWKTSQGEGEEEKKELGKATTVMLPDRMPRAWCYEDHVERLVRMLKGRRAMSVVLVGPSGVGKTAIIQELVRRRSHYNLDQHSFHRTSGARLVAGMSGFGDWQDRCLNLLKEVKEENAILYLGNLLELVESGRSSTGSESMASFFRPRMVRGEMLALLECTVEQLEVVEKREPGIFDGLRTLRIEEPAHDLAQQILQHTAEQASGSRRVPSPDAETLERVASLHRRYMGYSAWPGKPVRFLQRMIRALSAEEKLEIRDVNRAFSAETGLPLKLLEDSIALDLDDTRAWFLKRIMGQDDAVGLVVDTIAMIKARLSRPGKPLASFLFVGPTGVGKTELARSLAEFFYGSADRMIRLDMSEYNAPGSSTRLVSSAQGGNEGILTAKMRDQPFSLLLLDEFEKADPEVFDLFLQLLGEARLTDGAGRVADFSNAMIIMTSNLGASTWKAGGGIGFGGGMDSSANDALAHFTEEAQKQFRPEFFNRMDRIVPFLPLERESLRGIVRKELERIHERDGIRERQLKLEVSEELVDDLLTRGFDPRYGARPLRREIEKRVLRPVAGEVNEGRQMERGSMVLGRDRVQFTRSSPASDTVSHDRDRLENAAIRRRNLLKLKEASFVAELRSEHYRLSRRIEIWERKPSAEQGDVKRLFSRRQQLDDAIKHLEEQVSSALAWDEALLLKGESAPENDATFKDQRQTMVDLFSLSEDRPERITLVLQGNQRERLVEVALDYERAAEELGNRTSLGFWSRHPKEAELHKDGERSLPRQMTAEEVLAMKTDQLPNVLGFALQVEGASAYLLLERESGAHEFPRRDEDGKKKERIVVTVREYPLKDAWEPLEDLKRPAIENVPVIRSWPRDYYSRSELKKRLWEGLIRRAENAL